MGFTIAFAVLAALCLTYFVIIVSYSGIDTAFGFAWAVAAILFGVVAFAGYIFHKKHIRLPSWLTIALCTVVGVALAIFIIAEAHIVRAMGHVPSDNLEYVIVLGAQIRGSRISKSLEKRLIRAKAYLDNNPNTQCIVSGGKGNGENLSEAQAMYDYLVNNGIDASRIIMEDKSASTKENIEFSMKYVREGARVGVVSSNFHVYRASLVCSKLGYDVEGIAAGSDRILFVNYMVREFAALVRYSLGGMV